MNKTSFGRFWAMFLPQAMINLRHERTGERMGRAKAAMIAMPATAVGLALLATVTADQGIFQLFGKTASANGSQVLQQAATAAGAAASRAVALALDAFARAPALALGLAVAGALPALALLGLAFSHKVEQARTGETDITPTRSVPEGFAWPADAFVRVDGASTPPHPVGRELLRIGREDDNDLCLAHPTVHRYHAVVQRTPESDFLVVDLSARDGNGVMVNGRRVAQARLRDGDVIGLGEMRLRFEARPK